MKILINVPIVTLLPIQECTVEKSLIDVSIVIKDFLKSLRLLSTLKHIQERNPLGVAIVIQVFLKEVPLRAI